MRLYVRPDPLVTSLPDIEMWTSASNISIVPLIFIWGGWGLDFSINAMTGCIFTFVCNLFTIFLYFFVFSKEFSMAFIKQIKRYIRWWHEYVYISYVWDLLFSFLRAEVIFSEITIYEYKYMQDEMTNKMFNKVLNVCCICHSIQDG